MEEDLKVKVSKYMSYLLRHNPEDLEMNKYGFVDLDELVKKIKEHFNVDERLVLEIVEKSDRRRFEIVGNRIRALYGHSVPVELELEEDREVKVLYHGTTLDAAHKILREGLKPMRRRWVHLSPTIEIATIVGLRRTKNPVIFEIDVEKARKNGLKFYKATDKVYLCSYVPPKYIKRVL